MKIINSSIFNKETFAAKYLLDFRAKKGFLGRPECALQRMIDHRALEMSSNCIEQGTEEVVFSTFASFQVELLKDNFTFNDRLERNSFARIRKYLQKFFHFAHFVDICKKS